MPEQKQIRALLAVRDEKAISALCGYFRARGDLVDMVPCSHLLRAMRTHEPDIVLLQVESDCKLLASVRQACSWIPVVVLAVPSPDLTFEIAKLGAVQFLAAPLVEQDLPVRMSAVLKSLGSDRRAATPAAEASPHASLSELPSLFSSSARMMEIRDTIEKVANTSATVLIRGESGVGKELAARMIFARSTRSEKPFVKVNCAAIPHDLLESELFGYEAGAFTGAQRAKPGKFELADGGTLFLDEIGEMHPALQAKLLHVLQDGEFARLGAKHDTAVDVRVLCATNKLLEQRVAEGLFREDLFYRINVVTVHIPPLRERRNEIPLLLQHFIERYTRLYSRKVAPFNEELMQALLKYPWPGNIRELENLCKRYVIVGDATQIVRELAMHTVERRPNPAEIDLQTRTIEFPLSQEPSLLEIGRRAAWQAERQAIQDMLIETRWNRREAARRLRVSYKALLNKIKQIEVEDLGHNGHLRAQ